MWLIRFVSILLLSLCFTLSSQAANDPTRPPFTAKTMAPVHHLPLKLSMIIDARGERRAIINETVVSESDRVAGATVIKINPADVVLRRAGKNFKLQLPLGGVRKDSENG